MGKPSPKSQALPLQANKYDKILKENLRKAVPGIMQLLAGIHIVGVRMVNAEVQHTRERKADFIGIVTDPAALRFVLHIEFQVRNDPKMLYRMLEYKAMLRRKYPNLAVKQFVVFLGKNAPLMQSEFSEPDHVFRFHLCWMQDAHYRQFLEADKPEEILLAVLADFGTEPPENIATQIIERLRDKAESELEFQRFTSQLRVLSNIRNLQPLIEKLMEKISRFFVEERDPLFQKGKIEGKFEGKIEGKLEGKLEGKIEGIIEGKIKLATEYATNLIIKFNFDDSLISQLTGLETKWVKEIRDIIQKHPKDFQAKIEALEISQERVKNKLTKSQLYHDVIP